MANISSLSEHVNASHLYILALSTISNFSYWFSWSCHCGKKKKYQKRCLPRQVNREQISFLYRDPSPWISVSPEEHQLEYPDLWSLNHYGWKRPLRSSSPTINPTPPCPLTTSLSATCTLFLKTSREGDSTTSLGSLFYTSPGIINFRHIHKPHEHELLKTLPHESPSSATHQLFCQQQCITTRTCGSLQQLALWTKNKVDSL